MSEIKTRSPVLPRGDPASSPGTRLGCQRDAGTSVPARRPHPHPDATSPAAVGQELQRREAGAPRSNANYRPGCRAEKPPTPHPAPATAGLRATRGDQSNPTRDFSCSLALPTASFQGRGRMRPLCVCRSQPAWLARVRNGSCPLANTAWSEHGAAPGGSMALGCAGRPLPENSTISFLQPAWGREERGTALSPFRSLPQPHCRPLPEGRSERACRGQGALSQPLFFPPACRVPSSLAGC